MNAPTRQNSAGMPQKLRRVIRRAARKLLPRRVLTMTGFRHLLGLRVENGRPVDLVDGFSIEYSFDSLIGQLLFAHGEFEADEMSFVRSRLLRRAPGSVVMDIGANIGLHSLHAARLPEVARVLAFEPGRSTSAMLQRNIRRNGLQAKVELNAIAVAREPGSATFHFCADDAYSSLTPDDRRPVGESYAVGVTSVDAWLAASPIDRLDLIKIDVEGGEAAVISGARETLLRYRPELLIEIYEGSGRRYVAAELIQAICELGYIPFVLIDGEPKPYRKHDDANFNYYFEPRAREGAR